MELFQAHLGRRERWAGQDPKVTGALLDNEVLLGYLALEGTKERKETGETKSTLGEGREVLPSSHKLHLAGPPTSQTSSRHVLGCLSQVSPAGENWNWSTSC